MLCCQSEMKAQKDELQRQRDALQRQIDLFEEQRRHWLTSSDHRTGSPSGHPAPPTEPAADDRDRVSRVRNAECGSQPPVRHLSPVGLGRGNVADSRMLARVGSAGNMAALEGRTVTRGGSVGNLSSRRDVKPPVAVQQMSMTNISRLSSAATSPLRSTTSLPSTSSIHQLIPAKLSEPSNNPAKVARDQKCVEKLASRAVSVEKDASPAAGQLGAREPSRTASVSGNILPLRLAEGHPSRSSTSSTSLQCTSQRLCPAAAADDDDDDDECDGKDDDQSETEVLYF